MNVNICRPGYNASCALCCGSHNYAASPVEIDSLFRKRTEVFSRFSRNYLFRKMTASRSSLTGSYYYNEKYGIDIIITLPKLYNDAIQCPFVSVIDNPGEIGCALYPDNHEEDLRFECFQNYTCKYFSCLSRDLLNHAEIMFAAKLMGDWYYYTMLIHSIDTLRGMIKEYIYPENVSESALADVKNDLEKTLREEINLHKISSYFT